MSLPPPRASRAVFAGLFLVTLATLMYEIALTRIFSVTMWYHFAFVAVSVAMFGMSVGAIVVYIAPGFFSADRARSQLALSTFLFSISIVVSFFVHLKTPFVPSDLSLRGLALKAIFYAVISVPFVFSGIVTWPVAVAMAAGGLAGGYGGARLALRVGQKWVRRAVIAIGFIAFAWLLMNR